MCVGSSTKMAVKSFTIIEYENDETIIPTEIANAPKLSPFEWYVKGLPPELQDEMIKTDEFLLKDMKKTLQFKRSIDKYGHLTYKSPCGFQYTVPEFGVGEFHETSWDCPTPTCKRISINKYNGKSKISCHSSIVFNWAPSEFEDVRKLVAATNEVLMTAM